MQSTDERVITVILESKTIKQQRKTINKILAGSFEVAAMRAKDFRAEHKIDVLLYYEIIRYFGAMKEQIANHPLETTKDIEEQKETVKSYAYVAASFVPDDTFWRDLLNKRKKTIKLSSV